MTSALVKLSIEQVVQIIDKILRRLVQKTVKKTEKRNLSFFHNQLCLSTLLVWIEL